jgi:hypothetical protein
MAGKAARSVLIEIDMAILLSDCVGCSLAATGARTAGYRAAKSAGVACRRQSEMLEKQVACRDGLTATTNQYK